MLSRRLLPSALLTLAACGPSAEEREAQAAALHQQAAEDTVAVALAAYEPAAFDTVAWLALDSAVARGQVVFSYSCVKCHGELGDGTGGFVQRGDTLHPPSFLVQDWRFAENQAGLRQQIFVGTASGMPHWGLEGLKPRDIDAVASYIRHSLRSKM